MCLPFLAPTLVMLRRTNAMQTRAMAGMAYTVGYIVHGPSQLASAVQNGLSHHLSNCASCFLGDLQTAQRSDRQCIKHVLFIRQAQTVMQEKHCLFMLLL